ncbi:MAG: sigma-70 family RNA polymerase sigma factor [Rubripirellula sp.]
MSLASNKDSDLNRYRDYLRVLAEMQLNPRLRVKEDVSDIVQRTLIQAHQDRGQFRGASERELKGWLKVILNHTIINVAKKYGAKKRDFRIEQSIEQRMNESAIRLAGELPGDRTSPSHQLMRQERAEQVADALSCLLEDERSALMLKHVHDWKVAEIADHLGRTPEGVAGLLRRGLKKLRNSMQETDRCD